ncbi:MAG: hypothetical protein M0Z65_10080 [Firmicutes bacterium]|nr:hypothetical protein [Bacillota bacterium]
MYRWTACLLLFVLLLTGCGLTAEDEAEEAETKAEREARIQEMTAEEILKNVRNAMEEMKGTRWKRVVRHQFVFKGQPDKNTRVEQKQTVEVTHRPYHLHQDGTLTVNQEYVSETIPQRQYVTGKKAYVFKRNQWFESEVDENGKGFKEDQTPLEWLKEVSAFAAGADVKQKKSQIGITLYPSSSRLKSSIDWTPASLAGIPANKDTAVAKPVAKVRLWVDKKTFRLVKAEQVVEYTLRLDKQQVNVRQEKVIRLDGKVNKISVPEKIRQSAVPVSSSNK